MSVGLCRLLGLEHSLAATVACLLSSPLGEETKILSLLRVGCDPRSASVREGKRGVPGQLVTAADAELLVSFPLSSIFYLLPSIFSLCLHRFLLLVFVFVLLFLLLLPCLGFCTLLSLP